MQTPAEIRRKIQEPCLIICSESGKALKELAGAIKQSSLSHSPSSHIQLSKTMVNNLKSILNSQPLLQEVDDIFEIIPALAVASQLIGVISCVEKISEAINELSSLAHFKSLDNIVSTTPDQQGQHILHQGIVVPISNSSDHTIISVDESSTALPENNSSLESPVMSRS